MEVHVTLKLPFAVCLAVRTLHQNGFSVWLVGGCVRALLLGTQTHDFDLAADARPEQLLMIFRDHQINQAGIQHGTVMVIISGVPVEITTLRIDGSYSDRRRPDQVQFTSQIEHDLARRDFTINAMAWLLQPGCFQFESAYTNDCVLDLPLEQLIDPFQGQSDLADGVIRSVGQADKRFSEDALRIMRALRLAAVMGFSIEKKTAGAMRRYAVYLQDIAQERILQELIRMFQGAHIAAVLLTFPDIMIFILPECAELFSQPPVLLQHARRVSLTPADFVLRMTALLYHTDSARLAPQLLDRLRTDNKTRHRTLGILACAQATPPAVDQDVLRWMSRHGLDHVQATLDLLMADVNASDPFDLEKHDQVVALNQAVERLVAEKRCYRLQDLAIRGSDLLDLGLQPGQEIGRLLLYLLDQVISGKLENNRNELLQAAAAEKEVYHDRTGQTAE